MFQNKIEEEDEKSNLLGKRNTKSASCKARCAIEGTTWKNKTEDAISQRLSKTAEACRSRKRFFPLSHFFHFLDRGRIYPPVT
jgi:hypothetical protein